MFYFMPRTPVEEVHLDAANNADLAELEDGPEPLLSPRKAKNLALSPAPNPIPPFDLNRRHAD
jgi:hypothetical protein